MKRKKEEKEEEDGSVNAWTVDGSMATLAVQTLEAA